MNPLYLLAAFAIGVIFSTQPAINGEAGRILGSPVAAAAISVAITLIACLALLPFIGGFPKASAVAQLPWWIVFGGLIGAFVVAGGAAIAPVTGVALFFVCLVAGQLVGSVMVDTFGGFGMAVRDLSFLKIAGVAMALGGVIMVRMG